MMKREKVGLICSLMHVMMCLLMYIYTILHIYVAVGELSPTQYRSLHPGAAGKLIVTKRLVWQCSRPSWRLVSEE